MNECVRTLSCILNPNGGDNVSYVCGTSTAGPLGEACDTDAECESGNCDNNVCSAAVGAEVLPQRFYASSNIYSRNNYNLRLGLGVGLVLGILLLALILAVVCHRRQTSREGV